MLLQCEVAISQGSLPTPNNANVSHLSVCVCMIHFCAGQRIVLGEVPTSHLNRDSTLLLTAQCVWIAHL